MSIEHSTVRTEDVDPDAEVYNSTILDSSTILAAVIYDSKIGYSSEVGDGAQVIGSKVGDGVVIGNNCHLENCILADGTEVGDDTVLKNCRLDNGAMVGSKCRLSHVWLQEECLLGNDALIPSDQEWGPGTVRGPGPAFKKETRRRAYPATGGVILGLRTADLPMHEIHLESEDWGPQTHVGNNARIGSGSALFSAYLGHDADIGPNSSLMGVIAHRGSAGNADRFECGANSELRACIIGSDVTFGKDVRTVWALLRGASMFGSGSRLGGRNTGVIDVAERVDLGEKCKISFDTSVGPGCSIGAGVEIGYNVVIGIDCKIGAETKLGEEVQLGDDVIIGVLTDIGARVQIHGNVHIGGDVLIGADAVVDSEIVIGDGAEIGAAVRVESHVDAGAVVTSEEGALEAVVVPLSANAEAWLYARLADVAGSGKLTRDKVKRERPELLEHPLTKSLLKTRPLPTGPELTQLARGAKDAAKYRVHIIRRGWTELQRIGAAPNDVMRFEITPDLLDAIVAYADPKWHSLLKAEVVSYVERNNPHGTADRETLGWVRYFLVPDHGEIVVEEFQSDLPLLRWAMGESLDQLVPTDAFRKATGRVRVPVTLEGADPKHTHPLLVEAAEALGLDPIPKLGPGTRVKSLRPHGAGPAPMRLEFPEENSSESVVLRTPLVNYEEVSGPDTGEASRWATYLYGQGHKLARKLEQDPEAWTLDPEIFNDNVLSNLEALPEWNPARVLAVDIHNKIMVHAAEGFRNVRKMRRRLWYEFVVQLHDLYETMLAFVLDWAAGRTQTEEGESTGPGFEVQRVYVLTYDTKKHIRDAGRPPVFPYSKLHKRFQSAPKVALPAHISTSGMVARHAVTGDDEEGFLSLKQPPATARALRPNEPSIWRDR
jgi:NDP-sugar pyrophosphorylase family protein